MIESFVGVLMALAFILFVLWAWARWSQARSRAFYAEMRAVRLRARYHPTREQQDAERESALDRMARQYREKK